LVGRYQGIARGVLHTCASRWFGHVYGWSAVGFVSLCARGGFYGDVFIGDCRNGIYFGGMEQESSKEKIDHEDVV
jgi:hypothetical protein